MDDELIRRYQRWRESEEDGRDDEADAAFGAIYRRAATPPGVPPGFAARTLEAVAAAAARDARRAARTRRLLWPVGITGAATLAYFSAGFVVSALSAMLVRVLNLLIAAVVSGATWLQSGGDAWTVVSSLGRAAGALVSNPTITVTILVIQAIAIVALIALQRILGSDEESFR